MRHQGTDRHGDERHRERFCELFPNEPLPCRTQRKADRGFARTGRGGRQQQVGNVSRVTTNGLLRQILMVITFISCARFR